MRRVPDNAECAEVLIASIKSLTRPVMAFVRLSQGQSFGIGILMFLFLIFLIFILF